MRKEVLYILVLIALLSVSCSKKALPSLSSKGNREEYDTATFDYLYSEAIRQKLLGNPGDALKYLEQCVLMNPGSDASFHQMAQIALQLGNTQLAKKNAIRASALDEKNLWYQTFLGGIYYQEKNLDSAIIFYDKAIRFNADKIELKITLANMYSENKNYKKANEIYQNLEDKLGINENITLPYIRNLMSSGDFDDAEKEIIRLLNEYPEEIFYNGILAEIYRAKGENERAKEIYEKLMSLDSANPQTLLSLCDFIISQKDYDNLFNLLNIIALNNDITLESKVALLTKLVQTDDLVSARGEDLDIALRVFENAEDNKDVINLIRPELYQKMNQKELAIDRLEEIIKERQENYFAWEKLLFLYSETGNNEQLYIKGKECTTRFNMSYTAKVLYASAAMEKGIFDVALEELRKAKILAGSQKELLEQVQTMEADIYYRKGEYQKSFDLFREILASNPENLIVLNNYAYYLAEQNKDLKEAEKMIRYVVEKEKNNNTYLDTYAWVLYKRGNTREAIKIMEDIMSNDSSNDAEWFEHYGYMMKAEKKCDIAVKYWKKAIEISPGKTALNKEIENCKK